MIHGRLKPLPRRRKRMAKALPPKGAELRYRAFMAELVAFAGGTVRVHVLPLLPALLAGNERADAKPTDVNEAMGEAEAAFDRVYTQRRLRTLAERIGQQTDEFQRAQLTRQLASVLGVDPQLVAAPETLEHFVAQNVALIRTAARDYFSAVERQILEAARNGQRHETLATALQEELGVTERRAALIARDQTLSLYADVNQERQVDLGITQYIWRTASDERVRELHAERDGKTYEWAQGPGDASDPGDGEHPGDGINCRCYSDPVVEGLLE